MRTSVLLPLFFVYACSPFECTNPLVPHVGMADPHVHVFDGTLYMYATHDLIEQGETGCCGGDWWIWTAPYPSGPWSIASTLADPEWTPRALLHANWATDAAERNGKYYWYTSIGGNDIAVFESASPHGPWKDPLGKFLLSNGQELDPPTNIRDPGVFCEDDDDGTCYIVFGACSGSDQPDDTCYYGAELNPDMISYKKPIHLSVRGALGPYGPGKADDKPFLHKRGSTYYLSWGVFYATAEHVYGPYHYRGVIIDPSLDNVEPAFRVGNSTAEKTLPWYKHKIYGDRHGSFLQHHGQWYFFCNDYSHSDAPHPGFRDSIAAFVHYNDDGSIAPIAINSQGVGPQDLVANPVLPAENFYKLSGEGAVKRQGGQSTGFVIAGLKQGAALTYRVKRTSLWSAIFSSTTPPALRLANGGNCSDGRVEMRDGSVEGRLLASCRVGAGSHMGLWDYFTTNTCTSSHADQKASVRGIPDGGTTVLSSEDDYGDDAGGEDDTELVLVFSGCDGQEIARVDEIIF